ncbi:undecaprenyl-diphosphate phosphatase [Candidatus Saccharibacteria bacterium]|nr:undecaprenyl-diphosphate phosphatase [Candidatus Saccharibacteria bacterium]
MSIFESIILGLTQGLTEFIPVSSSGHLEIVQQIFGNRGADFHFFLELINFGTLLALLIFYRKRIIKILGDVFKRKNYRLALNILITSIPAGVIGYLLSDFISDNPFFSSIFTIGIALGLVGIVMVIIDKLPHLSKLKDENKLTPGRALAIGLVQTLALIPGVSRSGSTIITGKLVGLDSKSAAEYSFLASIPIMCGVCLKSIVSSSSRAFIGANAGMLLLSNAVAFASGLAAIYFIMKYIGKGRTFQGFGYYRIILALVVLIIALIS